MERKLLLATLTWVLAFVAPATAQHLGIGTDLVSRYVWRGTDYGESATLQPSLVFSVAGFELGTWASYSLSPVGADANEHDVWVGYTLETGSLGSLSVGVTDYYFPAPDGAGFFDFSGGGEGSHLIEPYLRFAGPASFPIAVFGAVAAHNDPDNATYVEISMPIVIDGVELGLTAGAAANGSELYQTSTFAIVNLGLSATRSLSLSQQLELPVTVAYILNPTHERSFLVFGFRVEV